MNSRWDTGRRWLMLLWLPLGEALAGNKFETIGSGVAGSTAAKLTFLEPMSIAFGVFFLVGALLSVTKVGRQNANSPNYSLWRQSAAVLFILSLLSFSLVLLI